MSRASVVLVGSFPPPIGGVAVHLERLQSLLTEDHQVSVVDLYAVKNKLDPPWLVRCGKTPPRNLWTAIRAFRRPRPDIVHYNVSAMDRFWVAGLLLIAVSRKAKRLLTIHSGSFGQSTRPWSSIRFRVQVGLIKLMDRVIVVNAGQARWLAAASREAWR